MCTKAAVKVNVSPVALDFFTLVTEDGSIYLNPNKILTEAECNQTYCFKLSIKACHGEELWDFDPNAFEYYFHQVSNYKIFAVVILVFDLTGILNADRDLFPFIQLF